MLRFAVSAFAGLLALTTGCAAETIISCSSAPGASTSFTATACSPEWTPNTVLDWGQAISGNLTGANTGGLGPASSSVWPMSGGATLDAAFYQYLPSGGSIYQPVAVASTGNLTRSDNTYDVWTGSYWEPARFFNPSIRTFAGHFSGPTAPSSSPSFGDNLLGAIATGSGAPSMTISFFDPVQYVAFQIDSAANRNFTAQLLAFDSIGNQLGTFSVTDTGGGGICTTLQTSSGPIACDDAPLLQYLNAQSRISTIEILTDDSTGFYIDQLSASITVGSIDQTSGGITVVPEPGAWWMAICALCALAVWRARRRANPQIPEESLSVVRLNKGTALTNGARGNRQRTDRVVPAG